MRLQRFSVTTHRVHPLVAPSVGWAKVAFTLNCLAAAPIECLVLAATARATDPLDVGALVIVRHTTRPVGILDFRIICVTPDTVDEWRRCERREKGGKCSEGIWWRRGDMGKHVCVQGLWGYGVDEGM
jgi:hypothetical protein